MKQSALIFVVVAVLTALLAAFSILVQSRGYAQGATGLARLDGIASAATFLPIAALYGFACALVLIAPSRAAGILYSTAIEPLLAATLVLLASIVGLQVARLAFGNTGAVRALLNWQFIVPLAIIAAHPLLDMLRRDVLLRSIGLVGFLAITLGCLYSSFRI